MTNLFIKWLSIFSCACILVGIVSCRKNLLNQLPTTELAVSEFWKTEADARIALMGAYNAARANFDRDYYFDGQGEFVRTRGNSTTSGNPYNGGNYNPSGYGAAFDNYFMGLYGVVNRCNYVVQNVTAMLPNATPTSLATLETIIGEARLLRGMAYFRLICMWGDVPYFTTVPKNLTDLDMVERMPIKQIKDSVYADFTYAFEKLPASSADLGRAAKPAALAFRGKLNLYWASWNKNGWPELEGFTPSASEASDAFQNAADDFRAVINDYGLTLYLNGAPGDIDALGKADVQPNYFTLFTPKANGNPEMIMVFTHGGTGTGQGEELMRDVSGRSHEGSQCWTHPRYEIADRYQLVSTGDFAAPLIPIAATAPNARTTTNSAVNPNSYTGRDYRMKASIMWDYEISLGMISLKPTTWVPFIYRTWNAPVTIGGVSYLSYNTDGCNSGYVYRKFLRNYAGQGRSEGDFAWPAMRLADVYLMYAEANNEVTNGAPDALAVEVVNKVRARGNLPPLAASKTSGYQNFFDAIEQERIIELIGEGHRAFDIRRWRKLESIWGGVGGPGVWRIDTWNAQQQRYFQNATELNFEQCYIFRIPPSERDRNPKLTQNTPWR